MLSLFSCPSNARCEIWWNLQDTVSALKALETEIRNLRNERERNPLLWARGVSRVMTIWGVFDLPSRRRQIDWFLLQNAKQNCVSDKTYVCRSSSSRRPNTLNSEKADRHRIEARPTLTTLTPSSDSLKKINRFVMTHVSWCKSEIKIFKTYLKIRHWNWWILGPVQNTLHN